MQELIKALNTIANCRGTAKKVALSSNPELMPLMELAYNPFKRFHTQYNAMLQIREAYSVTEVDPELSMRVFKKDLRIGMAAKSINAVWPGLIPTHDVMLAKTIDWSRVRYPCWATYKLDGMRGIYRDGQFFFRNGKQIKGLTNLAQYLVNADAPVLDGELLIPGIHFQESSGLIRSYSETPKAEFHIIDLPEHHELQFSKRLIDAYIYANPKVHTVPGFFCTSKAQVAEQYTTARKLGYEGLVIKPPYYSYVGKRSYDWMKIKAIESEDLYVVDIFEGTGKYRNMLGGVVVDFNGVKVRCGSGFSDRDRENYWADPGSIIGRLVEVEYHEVTPDGSLRHPRFKGVRDDKA